MATNTEKVRKVSQQVKKKPVDGSARITAVKQRKAVTKATAERSSVSLAVPPVEETPEKDRLISETDRIFREELIKAKKKATVSIKEKYPEDKERVIFRRTLMIELKKVNSNLGKAIEILSRGAPQDKKVASRYSAKAPSAGTEKRTKTERGIKSKIEALILEGASPTKGKTTKGNTTKAEDVLEEAEKKATRAEMRRMRRKEEFQEKNSRQGFVASGILDAFGLGGLDSALGVSDGISKRGLRGTYVASKRSLKKAGKSVSRGAQKIWAKVAGKTGSSIDPSIPARIPSPRAASTVASTVARATSSTGEVLGRAPQATSVVGKVASVAGGVGSKIASWGAGALGLATGAVGKIPSLLGKIPSLAGKVPGILGKIAAPVAAALGVGENLLDAYKEQKNDGKSTSQKVATTAAGALTTGLDIATKIDPTSWFMKEGILKKGFNATGISEEGKSVSAKMRSNTGSLIDDIRNNGLFTKSTEEENSGERRVRMAKAKSVTKGSFVTNPEPSMTVMEQRNLLESKKLSPGIDSALKRQTDIEDRRSSPQVNQVQMPNNSQPSKVDRSPMIRSQVDDYGIGLMSMGAFLS